MGLGVAVVTPSEEDAGVTGKEGSYEFGGVYDGTADVVGFGVLVVTPSAEEVGIGSEIGGVSVGCGPQR